MQFGVLPQDPRSGFPRFMFHATKPPVIVNDQDAVNALGLNWSRVYIHQDFPKVMYNEQGRTVVVHNKTELEKEAKRGYQDHPYEAVETVSTMSSADKDSEIQALRDRIKVMEQVQGLTLKKQS